MNQFPRQDKVVKDELSKETAMKRFTDVFYKNAFCLMKNVHFEDYQGKSLYFCNSSSVLHNQDDKKISFHTIVPRGAKIVRFQLSRIEFLEESLIAINIMTT